MRFPRSSVGIAIAAALLFGGTGLSALSLGLSTSGLEIGLGSPTSTFALGLELDGGYRAADHFDSYALSATACIATKRYTTTDCRSSMSSLPRETKILARRSCCTFERYNTIAHSAIRGRGVSQPQGARCAPEEGKRSLASVGRANALGTKTPALADRRGRRTTGILPLFVIYFFPSLNFLQNSSRTSVRLGLPIS